MIFCDKCNNMYYIKLQDDDPNVLTHYCKQCGNEDSSQSTNIINNINKNDDPDIINEFTKYDPTLPRTNTIPCPNPECKTNIEDISREIIYIKYNETKLNFMYLCTQCNTTWKI